MYAIAIKLRSRHDFDRRNAIIESQVHEVAARVGQFNDAPLKITVFEKLNLKYIHSGFNNDLVNKKGALPWQVPTSQSSENHFFRSRMHNLDNRRASENVQVPENQHRHTQSS